MKLKYFKIGRTDHFLIIPYLFILYKRYKVWYTNRYKRSTDYINFFLNKKSGANIERSHRLLSRPYLLAQIAGEMMHKFACNSLKTCARTDARREEEEKGLHQGKSEKVSAKRRKSRRDRAREILHALHNSQ